MSKKTATTLAAATILLVILNLTGKGLGFIREVLFANYFGLGSDFDLYLVSAALPLTINTVILYICINYFIPTYHNLKKTSSSESYEFYKNSFWLFSFIGIILVLLLYFFSESILGFYTQIASVSVLKKAKIIFNLLLVSIPLNAGLSVLVSYLQAEYSFKHPAISNIILNVIFIVLLIVLYERTGIFTIPLAYVSAVLIQFIYLMRLCPAPGFLKLNWTKLLQIRRQSKLGTLFVIILIEAIGQLYMLTDRYFYSSVETGGIAALNYSYNLYLLPVSVLSFALTTVLFPKFAQTINNENNSEFRRVFNQSLEITILLFIPITMIFLLFGDMVIKLFYERGNFNTGATGMTFSVLKIYTLSLPFYAVYAIINKVIYSANKVKQLFYITLIGLIIKFCCNMIFVKDFMQEGLAWGTVISYLFFFLISTVIILKYTGIKPISLLIKNTFFLTSVLLLCYLCLYKLSDLFINNLATEKVIFIFLFIFTGIISFMVLKPKPAESLQNYVIEIINKYKPAAKL